MRLKVNTTSSALKSRDGVKYAVVWNFTPRRRWKVYTRPSAEISQLSASAGATEVSPLTNSTSRLYSGSAASLSVAVVYCAVSNPAGLPSEQNTRLPAAWAKGEPAHRAAPTKADKVKVWRMTVPILLLLSSASNGRVGDTGTIADQVSECSNAARERISAKS